MFWGFGLLLPVLLLGRFFWFLILALLVLALLRRNRRKSWPMAFSGHASFPYPSAQPAQLSAMEILRQRYARGEIDHGTFEQMRERLDASGESRQQ